MGLTKQNFSALLLLTLLATPAFGLLVPSRISLFQTNYNPQSNPTVTRISTSLRLRGDINSNQERFQDKNDNDASEKSQRVTCIALPQQQQLSFLGAPVALLLKTVMASLLAISSLITREIRSLSFHQKLFFIVTFVLGFACGRMRPFWKRYTSVADIPMSMFGNQAPILRGRAVSVSDGDTIRFLHQPTIFHPTALKKGEKSSTIALPIRLCTIDTPETAKFGKSGQPFGQEAKERLSEMLKEKQVRIRLLQKDQYGRAVAEVFTQRFPFLWRKYMDQIMLKKGLAEVYTGGGAVYGPLGKDMYLAIQDEAKKAKKGIWSQKKRESAAEYKKRTK